MDAKVEKVFYVSSDVGERCKLCDKFLFEIDIGEKINHYLEHGCKLLHVGSETTHGDKGPWHCTVAVLGK
jgi:hypothetical protein